MSDEPTDVELTRLADGSLPADRAATLRARIAASPELQARLREQERGVAVIRVSESVAAPASLHAAIGEQTARGGSRGTRDRLRSRSRGGLGRLAGLGALRVAAPLGGAVVAAVVVVVVLTSGSIRRPTVLQTARLAALATPTRGAPAPAPGHTDLLSLRVGSVAFPAYEARTGWRATGARTDELAGRRVQTVFYDVTGRQVGYSIVAGPALPDPPGHGQTIAGVWYVTTAAGPGGARLIAWREGGHSCVIAARGIGDRALLALATSRPTT